MDRGGVWSVTSYSRQQQQQGHEASTNIVDTGLSCSEQQQNNSTQAASSASIGTPCNPPCVDAQPVSATSVPAAPAPAPADSFDAPGCSSTAASNASGEDDDGDCLVLEPEWVTPDGGEVDLNKVSDYELRLVKVSWHHNHGVHRISSWQQPVCRAARQGGLGCCGSIPWHWQLSTTYSATDMLQRKRWATYIAVTTGSNW
jgi:hypothetical protein